MLNIGQLAGVDSVDYYLSQVAAVRIQASGGGRAGTVKDRVVNRDIRPSWDANR